MSTRREIDARAGGLMLVLCAIWGLQQVAIKSAGGDIAPILQIATRSAIAAVLVAVVMLIRGEHVGSNGAWRPGLVVGFLFALEYLFVGEGLRFTTASHMAIFLYTAPIFAALGLHWKLPAERLKPLQWAGIGLAFGGIIVSFTGRGAAAVANASTMWIGDLLGLAAGMAWGATTLAVRFSSLASAPATATLLYQLLGAAVILSLTTVVLDQTAVRITAISLASLAFQSVVVSFLSFLAWFSLLRVYLASRLGVLSFMTPLFGIGFGVWLLDEPLDPSFVTGALLVLTGILLVSGHDSIVRMRAKLSA
jgi:drug/metabolite transporter (DMT)-like permease